MASHTIRLEADSKNTNFSIVDSLTSESLFWWRGNDLRIEIALSDAGQFLTSSDIGSINVVVKNLDATTDDAALMIATLGASDCDSTFTANDFDQGVKQLCVAEFTRVDSALDAGEYVIVISHTDPNGNRSTHLHSRILVKEDQHDSLSLSAPPTPATDYYTQEESDSRFASQSGVLNTNNELSALSQSINENRIKDDLAKIEENNLDITNLFEKPIGAIFPTTSGNVIQDLAYSKDGKTMYVTQDVSDEVILTVIKNHQVINTVNLGDKGHGEGLFFAPYMGKRRLFLADSVPSATIWLLSEDLLTSTAITVALPTAADSGWLKSNYCEESETLICRYVDATGGQHVTLYDWDDSLANPIGTEGLTITLNDIYIANNPLQAIAIDSSNVYTISGRYELASVDRISKLAIYDRETGLEVSAHDILLDVDVASNYGDKYEPEGATWYNLPNGKKELHFGIMMGLTGENRHYISSFTNEPLSGTRHFTLNMADDTITPFFDSNYPSQSSETFVSVHKVNDNISSTEGAQIFSRQASNMGSCQGDANLTSHGIIASYRYGFNDEIEKDIRIYDFGREFGTDVTRVGVEDSEIGQNNRIYGALIF